jgi:hypothetical protein
MKILFSYRLNFGLVFLTFQALEISFVEGTSGHLRNKKGRTNALPFPYSL